MRNNAAILLAIFVFGSARAEETITPAESTAPGGVPARRGRVNQTCGESFAQTWSYQHERISVGMERGNLVSLFNLASRRLPFRWTDDHVEQLAKVKATDFFPLSDRPGYVRLDMNHLNRLEFEKFMKDYYDALYSRLEQLNDGNNHSMGKQRLRQFRAWLDSESPNAHLAVGEYSEVLAAIVKAYKADGKDYTAEQMADFIFTEKFLVRKHGLNPNNPNGDVDEVFRYLAQLPPTSRSLWYERWENAFHGLRHAGIANVKGLLGPAAVTTLFTGLGTYYFWDPLTKNLRKKTDSALDYFKSTGTELLTEDKANANNALVQMLIGEVSLKALMKAPNPNEGNESEDQKQERILSVNQTLGTFKQSLPFLFKMLKRDRLKGQDAAAYEKNLEKNIGTDQEQLHAIQKQLDDSLQNFEAKKTSLEKLVSEESPRTSANSKKELLESIEVEKGNIRTYQKELASIMADWMIAQSLYKDADQGNPLKVPAVTKIALDALQQDFTQERNGLKLSDMEPELIKRLQEIKALVKGSQFHDVKRTQEAVQWP